MSGVVFVGMTRWDCIRENSLLFLVFSVSVCAGGGGLLSIEVDMGAGSFFKTVDFIVKGSPVEMALENLIKVMIEFGGKTERKRVTIK